MTALTNSPGIQVKQVGTTLASVQVPIKNTYKIYQGALVCLLTANGFAVPAGTASTGPVAGVAQAEAATATADGTPSVNLLEGVFAFAPDATHPPVQADMFKAVYAKDDNTISDLSSDGVVAGILVGFEQTSGWPLIFINSAVNAAVADSVGIPATSITGALSTVADAPAKAVLTSIIAALVAHNIGINNTT